MEKEIQKDSIRFRYIIDYNDGSYEAFVFHILDYLKSRSKDMLSKAEAVIAGKSASRTERYIQKMTEDGYLIEDSSDIYKFSGKIPEFIFS